MRSAKIIAFMAVAVTAMGISSEAQCIPITYSFYMDAINNGLATVEQGVTFQWAGGSVTGSLDVADVPWRITTNPNDGEVVALFSFSGSAEFEGSPLEYKSNSYVAIFHTPDSQKPDSIAFGFGFIPFNVTPNLQLVAADLETFYTDTLSTDVFPNLNDLHSV